MPEDASLGSLARAYGEFKARPSRDWNQIELDDPEIVALVNLRVLSEQVGVASPSSSPEQGGSRELRRGVCQAPWVHPVPLGSIPLCGRYTLSVPLSNLVDAFDVAPPDFDYPPRFNIAPTQDAPVIAQDQEGRRMGLLRWGLIPSWAKDPAMGSRMINARSETVAEKPAFRTGIPAPPLSRAGRRVLRVEEGWR